MRSRSSLFPETGTEEMPNAHLSNKINFRDTRHDTVEYYLVIKMNEIISFVTIWTNRDYHGK